MAASKSVLISGCSLGGIGSALALEFHKQGYLVFATARTLSKVSHLSDIGIKTLALDVTSEKSIIDVVRHVKELLPEGGPLDILVNNSGVGYAMPFADVDVSLAKNLFETNVFGRWNLTQAFLPMLLDSRGTIVNIGSISGICPTPWSSIYNAACSAVHQWSDTLRMELAPFGVKVVLVITGAVKSHFLSNLPVNSLPEGSIYLPCKEQVEATMLGKAAGDNFYATEEYARIFVSKVTRTNGPKRVWLGTLVHRIWIAHTFLWDTAWDFIAWKPFGLADLERKTRQNQNSPSILEADSKSKSVDSSE